ncbi:MAG: hypothetical protein ACRQFF_01055 [Sphaerochaeta sp.]
MKKLIIFILFVTVLSSKLFASNGNVYIQNSVDETALTTSIRYNNSESTEINSSNDSISIIYNDSALDDTDTKTTNIFEVLATANLIEEATIDLQLDCGEFLYGTIESGIYPYVLDESSNKITVNSSTAHRYDIDGIVIPSNTVLNDEVVSSFYLEWAGATGLAAGTYQSTITITITDAS